MKKFLGVVFTVFVAIVISSCLDDDSDTPAAEVTPALPTSIPTEFVGDWVRNNLAQTDCEEDYEVDGIPPGSAAGTESQGAYMSITSSSLMYFWQMYMDSRTCEYSSAAQYITDNLMHTIEIIAYTANTSVTIKGTVSSVYRAVTGATSVSRLNGYNSNLGACGKINWVNATSVDYTTFSAGCGAVGGEDGMDDFKFSTMSVNDVIYWKVTINGSNVSIASSTDNITYATADEYYKK